MTSKISPAQSGVYAPPVDVTALRDAAAKAGIAWFDVNLARAGDKREFLAACAKSLRLPRSFGANWDALADCLKDLLSDSVVNCRNCDMFAGAAPDDYATALEIFQDAANFWEDRGSTFVVLVDAEPDGIGLARFAIP